MVSSWLRVSLFQNVAVIPSSGKSLKPAVLGLIYGSNFFFLAVDVYLHMIFPGRLHDNSYAASERKDLLFNHDEMLLDFAKVGLSVLCC